MKLELQKYINVDGVKIFNLGTLSGFWIADWKSA